MKLLIEKGSEVNDRDTVLMFASHYGYLEEVKLFIKDSNKEDLIWFLRACEQAECYNFCQYLKEIIDE